MKKLIILSILLCSLAAMGQKTKALGGGITVFLKQVPSGINQTQATNNNGVVSFKNLPPGKYEITFEKKRDKNMASQNSYRKSGNNPEDSIILQENHNSSRSNKSSIVRPDGSTDVNFAVTLMWNGSSNKQPDQPMELVIGPTGYVGPSAAATTAANASTTAKTAAVASTTAKASGSTGGGENNPAPAAGSSKGYIGGKGGDAKVIGKGGNITMRFMAEVSIK